MLVDKVFGGMRVKGAIRWAVLGLVVVAGFVVAAVLRNRSSVGLAPVIGRVTLDGQSLVLGVVAFVPDGTKGTAGVVATGMIGEDGTYRLESNLSGLPQDGAVVGWHRVRVQARKQDVSGGPSESLVSEKYDDPDRSGLTFEVKPGRLNRIDLELVSVR